MVSGESPSATSACEEQPTAVYVHVPFCAHRCGYCDFTLVADRDDLIDRYLDALEHELDRRSGPPAPVATIFFGGGTPSRLPPRALARLFRLVLARHPLQPDGEFSLEANPLDVDVERLAVLREFGVNRVSLGVQSFDPAVLRTLERDHSPDDARAAVERTTRVLDNVAVDLIFGVPGQSLDSWRETLVAALALVPRHVSTYGLTFEKGTAFWGRRLRGTLQQAPEDLERAMYELAMDRLPAAGLSQYELSNFAVPGFECRHNLVYWESSPFFGYGPGAASYLGGIRRVNHRSTTTWMHRVLTDRSTIGEQEQLAPEARAREAVMLGLRRTGGIDRREFAERFGFDVAGLAGAAWARLHEAGWLEERAGRVRLTREGRCVADTVSAEFLSS